MVLAEDWHVRPKLAGGGGLETCLASSKLSMIARAGCQSVLYWQYSGICGSIGPSDECAPITISFAEHAGVVAADIAACGTITLM